MVSAWIRTGVVHWRLTGHATSPAGPNEMGGGARGGGPERACQGSGITDFWQIIYKINFKRFFFPYTH